MSIEVTILDNYKIEKITPRYVDDLIYSDLTLLTSMLTKAGEEAQKVEVMQTLPYKLRQMMPLMTGP